MHLQNRWHHGRQSSHKVSNFLIGDWVGLEEASDEMRAVWVCVACACSPLWILEIHVQHGLPRPANVSSPVLCDIHVTNRSGDFAVQGGNCTSLLSTLRNFIGHRTFSHVAQWNCISKVDLIGFSIFREPSKALAPKHLGHAVARDILL
jgi:hypothetical protein